MVQRSKERETMEARPEMHGKRKDLTYDKSRQKVNESMLNLYFHNNISHPPY